MPGDRLARALQAIDAANAEDPQRIVVRGRKRAKELAHAELMSEWVAALRPEASEALLLAARAHHIRRWELPRSAYPEGRRGYLAWRTALAEHHAKLASAILEREGYAAETRDRVRAILRKRGLGRDPEVQVFEDALCLVFLETQLADFTARYAEKLEDVVRKTLRKMSEEGIARALELPLSSEVRDLLRRIRAESESQ